MTDYPYDMDLVVDPLNPANVVANGLVSIYDPADTAGTTLLALKDPSGNPLPNPVQSNAHGFIPPRIATTPQTLWKSGTFVGFFNSYKGLRDEAVGAKTAAEAAAGDASATAAERITTAAVDGSGRLILTKANAETVDAGAVVGPQGSTGPSGATGPSGPQGPAGVADDASIAAQVNTTGSATRAALNATYALKADVATNLDGGNATSTYSNTSFNFDGGSAA